MRPTSLQKSALVIGLVAMGCSGTDGSRVESGAGGGQAATGGASTGGSGSTGAAAPGGASGASGADSSGGSRIEGTPIGGGSSGTGATSGGGSGGSVVIPDTCSEGNRTISSNGSGTHCGYTYEYWKDSGSGTLTLTSDGFNTNWSGINNLLGRKGLRPGSRNQVVTYDADYQPNGNSYLCIYGWMRDPLVEYYIVDSWGDWRPPGDEQHMGTVSSDGGSYDLYRNTREGETIDGYGPFTQYWSVRTTRRESGTITVGNHFTAWANAGMSIGSLYEVSLCVEGYQSTGTASVRMTMQ